MLIPALLALGLTLAPAVAQDDEGYAMNDLGATATLPKGWSVLEGGWADWELKAESSDRTIRFHMYMQPFQVDVSEAAAKVWAEGVREQYEGKGHTEVQVVESGIGEIGGRPWAHARVEFKFKSDPRQTGVVFLRSYTSAGQVVHMTTLGAARNATKADAALLQFAEALEITKEPLATAGDQVSSEAGFAATLPPGWRAPVLPELGPVRKLTEKAGEGELSPDECWVAIRPPASGEDPDVMFACQTELHLGPLDEHSFEGVEAELYDTFFGRAAEHENPPPHGEQVQIGDRVGVYYRPPVAGMATRLAIAPYNGGLMTMWGMGQQLDDAGLDGAMMATLPTVKFTAADGGHPIIGADKWAAYYLKYRPTSPMVLIPGALLVGVVFVGVSIARRPKSYDDE